MVFKDKNLFDKIISEENIYNAWREYRRGKKSRQAVREFERNLEKNLLSLILELESNCYIHGQYKQFIIQDSKRRIISSPSIKDHIVHRAIYRVLYPLFDKIFFSCSYSCRVNYGVHKCALNAKRILCSASNNYVNQAWVAHGDVRKCFDSINHNKLKDLLKFRISCVRTLDLLSKIIDSYSLASIVEMSCGIPLGNLTSQLFINIYLHELDFFVKQKMGIKYYIRYADDILIINKEKNILNKQLNEIRFFLKYNLFLEIPDDHLVIKKAQSGIEFVGFKFLPNYFVIKQKSFSRIKNKFINLGYNYEQNKIDIIALESAWQSYCGMLQYGCNFSKKHSLIKLVSPYVT